MFSLRSVKKFLEDHPEYAHRKKGILKRAEKLMESQWMFQDLEAQVIFGDNSLADFFLETALGYRKKLDIRLGDCDADVKIILAKRKKEG